MRVGFVTQLLWDRYGPFWRSLVADAGAETVLPVPERVFAALEDRRVQEIAVLAFRLAAAQAVALHDADVLVVPDLSEGIEALRGGGQDPWIADFPHALGATVAGLPPLVTVPASLTASVEARAIEVLYQIAREPARVRTIWDRFRARARPPRTVGSKREAERPGVDGVGILGQPWILQDALVAMAVTDGERPLGQHRFDPAELRQTGALIVPGLLPTDQEVLGAARLLSRRGDVARLRMVVDPASGSDAWLLRQVRSVSHKTVEVLELQLLLGVDGGTGTLLRIPEA